MGKVGAPFGNKNAVGNRGGKGALFGNANAYKHGRYVDTIYRLFFYDYCNLCIELERYDLLEREPMRFATQFMKDRIRIEIYPLFTAEWLVEYVTARLYRMDYERKKLLLPILYHFDIILEGSDFNENFLFLK